MPSSISRRTAIQALGLVLPALALRPEFLPTPAHVASAPSGLPLRYYADRIVRPSGKRFKVGIHLEGGDWNDPTGVPEQLAKQQFNHLVNHAILMNPCYPGPGQWDFSGADWIVQKAQAASQSMIGMHLVWGSVALGAIPNWIVNGGYNRDQLIGIMEAHIAAVMNRYKGVIGAYTVVNEKWNGNGTYDWWYQHIGTDYHQIAFEKAREIDPSAVLIYNHYSNETTSGGYYTTTKTDVDYLKSLDLVDAVGVQMHLWSNRPSKADVTTVLQSYGVPVWVTEFDSFQLGWQPDPVQEQGEFTLHMIEAAFESGACDCFTTWDIRRPFKITYLIFHARRNDPIVPVAVKVAGFQINRLVTAHAPGAVR
ncbi:MAG: endo-1,4-beta-xylanase [Anaerolineales bacterium]|nr:endo-1,4-beta-xylanase [Anaerolineales bacterium]